MMAQDRLVVALATVYVPKCAERILAYLNGPSVELAARLVAAPRTKRLQALGEALLESGRERVVSTRPPTESPRITALLRGDPLPSTRTVSPIIRRLCRELCAGDLVMPPTAKPEHMMVRPRDAHSFTRPDGKRAARDLQQGPPWHGP